MMAVFVGANVGIIAWGLLCAEVRGLRGSEYASLVLAKYLQGAGLLVLVVLGLSEAGVL